MENVRLVSYNILPITPCVFAKEVWRGDGVTALWIYCSAKSADLLCMYADG